METLALETKDREMVEEHVSLLQDAQAKAAGLPKLYEQAAVTASFSVGPTGAQMQGWITYISQEKIYFKLTSTTYRKGVFAGGGVVPEARVLSPKLIRGKTGNMSVGGFMFGGSLSLFLNGELVCNPPIPLAGAAPWFFHAKGKVLFE